MKNIEFGLKEEKLEKKLIEERINDALDIARIISTSKKKN